jgi:hypothetical protein
VMSRCMAGFGEVHASVQLRKSVTIHRQRLRSGADKPVRLARDRQSECVGTLRYATHPHSRMTGERMPRKLRIAQCTVWILCLLSCLSPRYFRSIPLRALAIRT